MSKGALEILSGTLLGLPAGLVAGTIRAVPWLRHWPRAGHAAVRTVAKSPRLGPVLKSVCVPATAVGSFVAPGLLFLAAAGYGAVGSLVETIENRGNPVTGVRKMLKSMDEAGDKLMDEVMPKMRDYLPPPLTEGERVYEIPLVTAGKALAAAALGALFEAPFLLGVGVIHLPALIVRSAIRIVMTDEFARDSLFTRLAIKLCCLVVLCLAVAIVVLAIPIASLAGGMGIHIFRVMKFGFWYAIQSSWNDLRIEWHTFAGVGALISKNDAAAKKRRDKIEALWNATREKRLWDEMVEGELHKPTPSKAVPTS